MNSFKALKITLDRFVIVPQAPQHLVSHEIVSTLRKSSTQLE